MLKLLKLSSNRIIEKLFNNVVILKFIALTMQQCLLNSL